MPELIHQNPASRHRAGPMKTLRTWRLLRHRGIALLGVLRGWE